MSITSSTATHITAINDADAKDDADDDDLFLGFNNSRALKSTLRKKATTNILPGFKSLAGVKHMYKAKAWRQASKQAGKARRHP